jgi:hypothetical protein
VRAINAATAMFEPDRAPNTVDSTPASTNCRPRTCPTSRSTASNSTAAAPERNRISPIRTNRAMAVSVPVVAVVKMELATIPKA